MPMQHTAAYLEDLVRQLCRMPAETETVEFKENFKSAEEFGKYVSALSNAAAYTGQARAYLVFGVRDSDHAIVGTRFDHSREKVGNEPLENWLARMLDPQPHFSFFHLNMDGNNVVLAEIEATVGRPVTFQKQAYIRVGSVTKPLKDIPEREKRLWNVLNHVDFEAGIALEHCNEADVLHLLDHEAYFRLTSQTKREFAREVVESLEQDRLVERNHAGGWNITNLGAILFGRDLSQFASTRHKRIRIIQYRGTSRLETISEYGSVGGYLSSFEEIIDRISDLLPPNEVLGRALRTSVPQLPPVAVRELVANALIHQDFDIRGAGPMIEIFENRIEITNPGRPLMDPLRFVDNPPRSRNESLASLAYRAGICELRGSGWDKIAHAAEVFQLPAPEVEVGDNYVKVVVLAPLELGSMTKDQRVRAVYLHACLQRVTGSSTTNPSIRKRFKIEERNRATASRLINDALAAKMIIPEDPQAARKSMRYMPFWVSTGTKA